MGLKDIREILFQLLHYFWRQLVVIFVQAFIYAFLDGCLAAQVDKRDLVFAIL